jgi:hypothetical protein
VPVAVVAGAAGDMAAVVVAVAADAVATVVAADAAVIAAATEGIAATAGKQDSPGNTQLLSRSAKSSLKKF